RVQPLPGEDILPALEKSLGKPSAEIFREFALFAQAAGSIGQVHRAVLMDGSPVIVKVKRFGIEKIISEDVALLEAMADLADRQIPELAAIRPKMLAGELRRTIQNELDFVGEASSAGKFRQSMQENQSVLIPRIHWEYVTDQVLVMDQVEGKSLAGIDFLPDAERRRVAEVLVDCFMRQYFETGLFHADPHPGNIIYCPGGAVSLVDFGQTGRLSEELRRVLGRMLMALKAGDAEVVADIYAEVGEFSPGADIPGFRIDLAAFIDRNYGLPADRINFSALAQESLEVARKNGLYLPRDFVLLVKSLLLVAGVVRDLDPGFQLDLAIAPAVRRLGIGMYRPEILAKRGWRLASRFAGLIRRMPDDFRDLVEKARTGRFTVVFHHDNLQGVAERTGRAIDRLALSIIGAAVIIGGSIIIAAGGSGAAAGYVIHIFGGVSAPVALAGLGFVLALFLAIYVVWGIFRDQG
ncbi:MAG: AarF/ABC1/UbiB kinase family protein, partial [Planctomycetes bacterium]|nr:AarF/ABC1/UbiB kinase family protein [Planctomycetota bacterium]